MIPIFIINLPKDKDRRAFQEKQMKELDLPFQFVDAFYGDDPVVVASCDDELAKKEHGKVLMKGEKGCAYSHRFCYEIMEKENIPCALVMEDDVVLPKDFKTILTQELHRTPRSWGWISFDYPTIGVRFIKAWVKASLHMIRNNPLFLAYALLKFPFIVLFSLGEALRNTIALHTGFFSGPQLFLRPLYNAGAYLITQEGIKAMKPLLYPIRFSADRTPNQARVKTGLKMRWYVPQVVRQLDEVFGSNTII
jgi:GR25 family glycosyltransferase involved in LPS biosynthesis